MNDEAQLIERSLQGDSNAFGELVRRYQARLYTSVVHVIGCRDDAEDIVQEAFVQAYLKLRKFRGSSSFYTWIYRIAFNTAISERRRQRPAVSVEQTHQQQADPRDPSDAPDGRLLREELVGQVHAALETLNEEYRAVMVLRELDGCDYEAIAEILDISVGTVRSRLHRARSLLREKLKEIRPEEPAE